MAPAAWAPSTTTSAPRSWAMSAMARTGMTAPVVHRTCEIDTSRVSRGDGGIEGGDRPLVVAVVARVDECDVDAEAVAERVERPEGAGVFVGGRHGPVARAPVGHRVAAFMPSVVEWFSATAADVRPEDRRDAGTRLGHPTA